ncbi:MAG: hypothetical protein KAR13_00145 [Desulfobulbaceae bacterium]|nr:hypothetical protein [Desulfobulbaceae bacterium]
MFYLLFIPTFFVSILMVIHLRNLKKHDIVLYKFCQVRRESMQFLRNNWEDLPREEYLALRKLLSVLNTTINRYNDHKTVLFNLRRFIEEVKEFDSFSKKVASTEMPKTDEIQQLYIATSKSFLYGFFAYTPLIKSEIFVKISIIIISLLTLVGIEKFNNSIHQIVESINNAREQAHDLGVRC